MPSFFVFSGCFLFYDVSLIYADSISRGNTPYAIRLPVGGAAVGIH